MQSVVLELQHAANQIAHSSKQIFPLSFERS